MIPYRVVVVGGGISGLTAAHRILELGRERGLPLEVTVLEASARFGGVIETQQRDGFLVEAGPDAFLTEKPWAVELCRRLGLSGELLGTQPAAQRSFVAHRGRLVPVPEGVYLVAPTRLGAFAQTPLLSPWGKLRAACEPWVRPRRGGTDESVGGFVRRRFGREVFERLGQPMMSGVYTADPDRLSLRATLPRFWQMEREHGSIARAFRRANTSSRPAGTEHASGPRYSLFVTLRGGLSQLIGALTDRLGAARLERSTSVTQVQPGTEWTVTAADGRRFVADTVCLALPAHQTARLVRPFAAPAAEELDAIPYESVATVNVAVRREDVTHSLGGAGLVVPAVEGRPVLGCTFVSQKFAGRAPADQALLRVFVGGALHRNVVALDDAALERLVIEELRALIGLRGVPRFVAIHRHPQAMPQYHVGHLERLERIQQALAPYRGLFVAGNGYRGLGLPDCVRQAEEAAERILALAHTPAPVAA